MPEIIWGMICGWLFTLSGVFVGGLFVFRTKREPHEPFLPLKQPKGVAFNLEDPFETKGLDPAEGLPKVITKLNERFKDQMAEERREERGNA
jgi:hypothetical protein